MSAARRRRPAAAALLREGGAAAFRAYFNVADELDGGLLLGDLLRSLVKAAQVGAETCSLPWPPDLAAAEEYALSNREFVRGEVGW